MNGIDYLADTNAILYYLSAKLGQMVGGFKV